MWRTVFFKFLTSQLSMAGYWPTMAVTCNREFGARFWRGSLRNGHHVSGRQQARKVSEIAGKEHGHEFPCIENYAEWRSVHSRSGECGCQEDEWYVSENRTEWRFCLDLCLAQARLRALTSAARRTGACARWTRPVVFPSFV